MIKQTQTVWTDKDGRELLVQKGTNEFYVPLSLCTLDTIRELAAACYYATKPASEAGADAYIDKALAQLHEEVKP